MKSLTIYLPFSFKKIIIYFMKRLRSTALWIFSSDSFYHNFTSIFIPEMAECVGPAVQRQGESEIVHLACGLGDNTLLAVLSSDEAEAWLMDEWDAVKELALFAYHAVLEFPAESTASAR